MLAKFAMSKETAEYAARLARLKFPPAELERYAAKFARVIDYVEKLGELDTKGIEPTAHALKESGHDSRLRKDDAAPFNGAADILNEAPEKDGRMFVVPKVI
jgi:aspartyl-tRNA(Asn)/glutamyl-tRNA(Gln) amidotransferase subunit C